MRRWISNDAEAFGKAGNFHGRRSNSWGGFENKAQIFRGGEFESSTKVDWVGPDGTVRAIHDFSFCFGHQAFCRNFWGDSGKGVLVDSSACFLFSFGESDGAKDGAKDSSSGENFVGCEEKILGENNAIIFDFEREGEAEGGLHLRIPFCGKALGEKP